MVPPRSEIRIVVKLQKSPSERSFDKVDGVVDPSSVFSKRRWTIGGQNSNTAQNNHAVVQVANVSTHAIQLDSETPIGTFYPCGVSRGNNMVAHGTMYDIIEDIKENQVCETMVTNNLKLQDARENQNNRIPNVDLSMTGFSEDQQLRVMQLLKKFSDAFSKNDRDIGCTGLVKHKIKTEGSSPIKQKPYRLPKQHVKEAQNQLDKMIEDGVVERSESPWCFPVILVRKKDNSYRFCTDFRALNKMTITDAHPLPRIVEALDKLSGSKWFSCFDLSSGYWQVELDHDNYAKTAFTLGTGLRQYTVMLFGLENAPPTFKSHVPLHC